jgi:hypothetical protein
LKILLGKVSSDSQQVRFNLLSLLRLPIEDGIVSSNWQLYKLNSSRLTKWLKDEGSSLIDVSFKMSTTKLSMASSISGNFSKFKQQLR